MRRVDWLSWNIFEIFSAVQESLFTCTGAKTWALKFCCWLKKRRKQRSRKQLLVITVAIRLYLHFSYNFPLSLILVTEKESLTRLREVQSYQIWWMPRKRQSLYLNRHHFNMQCKWWKCIVFVCVHMYMHMINFGKYLQTKWGHECFKLQPTAAMAFVQILESQNHKKLAQTFNNLRKLVWSFD